MNLFYTSFSAPRKFRTILSVRNRYRVHNRNQKFNMRRKWLKTSDLLLLARRLRLRKTKRRFRSSNKIREKNHEKINSNIYNGSNDGDDRNCIADHCGRSEALL